MLVVDSDGPYKGAGWKGGDDAHGIRRPDSRVIWHDNRNQGDYPSAGQTRIEVSFQGSGTVLGQDVTNIATYSQILRPGGILYGEGDALYITSDGQSAHWKGFGVGRPTGPFPEAHFAVRGSAETESQALGRLNEIATVLEYDVDQEGNVRYTMWEWR